MSGNYAQAAATAQVEQAAPVAEFVPQMAPTVFAPPPPQVAVVAQYVEAALANRLPQIVATVTADVIGALTGGGPSNGNRGGGRAPRNVGGGGGQRGPDPALAAARERFIQEYCLKTEEELCQIAGTGTLDEITFKIDVLVVPYDPDQKLKITEGGRDFSLVKFSRDFGKTVSKRVKEYYYEYGFDLYYTYRQGEGFVLELTPNC